MEFSRVIIDCLKKIGQFFVPKYSETSLFLLSITAIFFFVLNDVFREQIKNIIFYPFEVISIMLPFVVKNRDFLNLIDLFSLLIIFSLIGFVFSLYNAFTAKKIGKVQSFFMLIFAISLDIMIGINLFYCDSSCGIVNSLMVCNIPHFAIIGTVLFDVLFLIFFILMIGKRLINPRSLISNKQINNKETVVGIVAIFLIYLLGNYLLKYCWPITFFGCSFYATRITDAFFRRREIVIKN